MSQGEYVSMRRSLRLGSLLLLSVCWIVSLAPAAGLSRLISYTSSLDKSTQQYGVYLPEAAAPSPDGFPAVLHMHGYGWSVSARFSDFQMRWADTHGWILINLNARGPQFYDGVGDVESRNVVQDAQRRFGVDLSRVFLVGGSMGGTGAYRLGIRYPELFAASVGVDGWSDFREWHYHWYARTDQREAIEEFRRPLLEAASPLYWAGRARWAAIQSSVSGQDNVVLPENGLNLNNALLGRSQDVPGAYTHRLFLDYEAGHGGSYRIEQIYDFFHHRQVHSGPPSFLCETPLLAHGEMYWASMLRLKTQGATASLESVVDVPAAGSLDGPLAGPAISRPASAPASLSAANGGPANSRPLQTATATATAAATAAATATVLTRNLTELAVHLQASPAASAPDVALYADGFLAYQGPPRTVTLQADLAPNGDLWGWHEDPADTGETSCWPRKTPQLEGPLGEAFKVPFMVAYGTAGAPAEVARNRREAWDFARGWDAFMVHAAAVRPVPEETLSPADLQGHSLVLFGTEHSSALLRHANAVAELPVHVRDEGVTVRDPDWGDRSYRGSHFGAFVCTPNPLTDFRTYLVILRGQWATKPDGSSRQGLEYDLEKLPWAYPDYVVFNTDQAQLPHVLNVNNKPPVTCYEAGYFVEAGYFDQDWQPYRSATLDRVRALKLPVKCLHVEQLRSDPDGLQVFITDAEGLPVPQARVTVQAEPEPLVRSAVTNEDGVAIFPLLAGDRRASVVNVMATGAVYDWQADRVWQTAQQGVGLIARATGTGNNGCASVKVELTADAPERATVRLVAPVGQVAQPLRQLAMGPGAKAAGTYDWDLTGVPPGTYRAEVTVTAANAQTAFSRPVFVTVGAGCESDLRLVELTLTDLVAGGRWQVAARLANFSPASRQVRVFLGLPKDRQYPPPQTVTVPPQGEAVVAFVQPPDMPLLSHGVHPARVYVENERGVTGYGEFTVK